MVAPSSDHIDHDDDAMQARDDTVSRMSQMLMQGWAMLASHCPICTTVLLRHRDHGMFCVSCRMACITEQEAEAQGLRTSSATIANDAVVDEEGRPNDDEDDWQPPTAEERRRIQERLDERDRVSQVMAAKMLAGWAMLNDHCTDCSTPLLRDPECRHFCVACDRYTDDRETPQPPVREGVEAKQNSAPDPASATVSTVKPTSSLPKVGDGCVLTESKQTLLQKLSQLNERMSEVQETGSVTQLANAMESVARAISAISDLTV